MNIFVLEIKKGYIKKPFITFTIIYDNDEDFGEQIKKNTEIYKILKYVLYDIQVTDNYDVSVHDNIIPVQRLYKRNIEIKDIKAIIKKIPNDEIFDVLYSIFMCGPFIGSIDINVINYERNQSFIDFNTRLEYLVNND